jgi:hypothetical protein
MYLTPGSNNKQPPVMNDGRNFANWQPEAVINNKIQEKEGINSNWAYRNFLQNNASKIMKHNYLDAVEASGNIPPNYVNKSSSNSPFIFNSTHDQSKPSYGYNNSDLKSNYLSREQLNARLIAPSIPTNV